jgi:hypothetical protein
MKQDTKLLTGRFRHSGFKRGDLVVTAEIHRVHKVKPDGKMEVSTVYPVCEVCQKNGYPECVHRHIVSPGPGQHGVMIPRDRRKT